jgi:hypothetical protein
MLGANLECSRRGEEVCVPQDFVPKATPNTPTTKTESNPAIHIAQGRTTSMLLNFRSRQPTLNAPSRRARSTETTFQGPSLPSCNAAWPSCFRPSCIPQLQDHVQGRSIDILPRRPLWDVPTEPTTRYTQSSRLSHTCEAIAPPHRFFIA